jgi:uncharacterized Zn finger protein
MSAPRPLPFGRIFTALLCVSIALLVTRVPGDAVANQDPPPADAARARASKQAMRDAARDVVKALEERTEAGEAMTPAFIELMSAASRRLCFAEEATAADKDAWAKALKDHLDRAKALHAMLDQRFRAGLDVSRVQLAQAKYSLSEAELWVAQGKAKGD